MKQYTLKEEVDSFQGNTLRNFKKLFNSGIAKRIIVCYKRCKDKPVEVSIPYGNPEDACVLIESVAAQEWRKRVSEWNKTPKGHTRSPKLGAKNLAFSKGVDPNEPTNYISRYGSNIIIEPTAAELIVSYAQENLVQLQLPELGDLF